MSTEKNVFKVYPQYYNLRVRYSREKVEHFQKLSKVSNFKHITIITHLAITDYTNAEGNRQRRSLKTKNRVIINE